MKNLLEKRFQAHNLSRLSALIFDMDGVLCHTMPYHIQAWKTYVEQTPELNSEIDIAQLATMGGKRNSELLPELLGRSVSAAEVERWGQGKEAVFRELIRDRLTPLPGLVEFLKQAQREGYKIGLGTSACKENMDAILDGQNLRQFFHTLVMETDVQRGKPDPQCYQLVAERLGVSPQECLVFEDAIAGVQAARNAGMACWGVLTTHSFLELKEAGASHCIEDFLN
ncbi:HAD-IA family hydrolase [Candidatus Synechococcus calcipolaris G9]|uniref:HAD-IA family hydrolase n=1 Tax=Candidatus Synechococcus calcipolaris G9 TaxID=1497997 RepID=A0ABT6F007_9SYNE|nr:HAD-IA family hydrolase [Candidatus Synechococcus calcipolaris]MDG2991194.1 HAD-IA family hydrolase [Candidatus Synechococcus calcipolaris G9]